ncbi:MAG: response regulator [Desulfobaccales bacterium]
MPRSLRRALELLAGEMEEGPFLREVCHLAVEAVGGAAAVILLPQDERLKPVAWAGSLPPVFIAASFTLLGAPEQHPFSQAYQTGVAVWGDLVAEDFGPLPWAAALREAHLAACLAVPLRVAGKTMGVLAVLGPEGRRLSAQKDLAELLAGVAAAGLVIRRHGEECRRLREGAAQGRGTVAAAPGVLWEEEAGVGRFQARLPGFSLVAANDALARMLGWPEADSLLEEFVPQDRVAEPAAWERLLAQAAQGRVVGVEVPFLRRDGKVATLRLWGKWDEAREGFTGVAVDISRLRELEEELARLQRSHRLLKEQYLGASLLSQAEQEDLNRELTRERQVADTALAACEAGVAAFTREGRLTHWNRAMESITGLTRQEVYGQEVSRVLPGLTAGEKLREIREARRLLDPKQPVQLVPGGTAACYDAFLTPLRDAKGEADGGIMVIRRLLEGPVPLEVAPETEVSGGPGPMPVLRGAGEDAARRRRERLEALGSLAGSLARDFDQILAVMLGYAEMAQAALPEEDPARAKLAQVLKAGRRGRDLVQQILAFSRPWERRSQPEEAGEGPEAPARRRQARGRILLAAGDESQGALWREILHSLGFEVHLALNGQEALELFRTRPQDFDLLLADQDLAPISGLDLAREVRTLHPGLPVILSLDPLDLVTLEKAKTAGVQDFALKPWSLSELTAALDRIFPPPGPKGLAS